MSGTNGTSGTSYDVVIVDAGIAGTLLAKKLGREGQAGADPRGRPGDAADQPRGLPRELLPGGGEDAGGALPAAHRLRPGEGSGAARHRRRHLQLEHRARLAAEGAGPRGLHLRPGAQLPLQKGPHPFASTYERVAGGTTWHWLGTRLRFIENDFKMRSVYGVERDWPFGVDALLPWYNEAESQIGVAADAAVQEMETKRRPRHGCAGGVEDFRKAGPRVRRCGGGAAAPGRRRRGRAASAPGRPPTASGSRSPGRRRPRRRSDRRRPPSPGRRSSRSTRWCR